MEKVKKLLTMNVENFFNFIGKKFGSFIFLLYFCHQLKETTIKNLMDMKNYTIYVEGIGYGEEISVMAKDIVSARKKAKTQAIKEFKSSLRARKVNNY